MCCDKKNDGLRNSMYFGKYLRNFKNCVYKSTVCQVYQKTIVAEEICTYNGHLYISICKK